MKLIVYVGIMTALAITITFGYGMSMAAAQVMTDNATMSGNMTIGAGNMTGGNDTEGKVSGVGGGTPGF